MSLEDFRNVGISGVLFLMILSDGGDRERRC